MLGIGTALILAAGAAMTTVSPAPATTAAEEGRFLAFVSCAILLSFLPLALASSRKVAASYSMAPILITLLVWAVPAGALRGGSVSLILAALALLFGLNGLDDDASQGSGPAATTRGFDLGTWMPAAVGLQLLLRIESLWPLVVSPQKLVTWFALPLAGVLAAALAARRCGRCAALIALLAVVVACGGFTVNGVLVLSVLATATSLGARASLQTPALAPPARRRAMAVIALSGLCALAVVWSPGPGVILVLGTLLVTIRRRWGSFLLVAAGLLSVSITARPWTQAFEDLWLFAVLFPFVPLVLWLHRRSRLREVLEPLASCLLLALVALRVLEPVDALAMPAAILALEWFGTRSRPLSVALDGHRAGILGDVYRRPAVVWLSILLMTMVAAAGYPWLRWPSLADTAARIGARDSGLQAVAFLGIVVLLHLLFSSRPRNRLARRTTGTVSLFRSLAAPGAAATLAIALVGLAALPAARARVVLDWPPMILDRTQPSWSFTAPSLPRSPPEWSLLLDATLFHSGAVAPGAEVLIVEIPAGKGETRRMALQLGRDTGDWAAARDGAAAPAPWLSELALGPGEQKGFFGQRYRALVELGRLSPAARVAVSLAPAVPAETSASLFRVVLVPSTILPRWRPTHRID